MKKRFFTFWRRVCFVDKFLLLTLLILLAEISCTLFFSLPSGKEANTIDVMVRTSAAAIFGYFVSANFDKGKKVQNSTAAAPKELSPSPPSSTTVKGQLGFSAESSSKKPEKGFASGSTKKTGCSRRACKQEIIVAVIGAAALGILLVFRNFGMEHDSAAGTVAQLRDFVSGCVGFLISSISSGDEEEA